MGVGEHRGVEDAVVDRAVARRARVVLVGDTVRLVAVVLVVGAADAVLTVLVGWRALTVLVAPPVVALVAARRSSRAGRDPERAGPAADEQVRLARRVLALALDRGASAPRVRLRPGPVVNAYGLGSGPRAVLHVGEATVGALDPAAVDAVLLHELHHLRPASRLRAGATHRGELLADLSAAAVVGPAAVHRALSTMEALAPGPAEVDAARAAGSPSAVTPRTGRRCTVPLVGERSARLAVLRWSLYQRCRALVLLGERPRRGAPL